MLVQIIWTEDQTHVLVIHERALLRIIYKYPMMCTNLVFPGWVECKTDC
jgi:hypothetical protein